MTTTSVVTSAPSVLAGSFRQILVAGILLAALQGIVGAREGGRERERQLLFALTVAGNLLAFEGINAATGATQLAPPRVPCTFMVTGKYVRCADRPSS